jgi:tellurite resistance-related uncharacterized protein
MLSNLPDTVSAYKRTSTFTKSTVPKGLLARHNTKQDTWGLIVIESGSCNYTIFNDNGADSSTVLTPDKPGVIEPQVFHKVELLSDDTTFYVEFYANESKDVGLPKFMKESDVQSVEKEKGSLERIQGLFIQIIAVGLIAMIVGFVLVQVSAIKRDASFDKIEE